MDHEADFRAALYSHAARACQLAPAKRIAWEPWNHCRLIFADWLEDEGRYAEAAATRADWICADGMGAYQRWVVRMPLEWNRPTAAIPLLRKFALPLNQKPLLHFGAMTLRLTRLVERVGFRTLHWTWHRTRGRSGATLDTKLAPGGYLCLFTPEKGNLQFEESTHGTADTQGS